MTSATKRQIRIQWWVSSSGSIGPSTKQNKWLNYRAGHKSMVLTDVTEEVKTGLKHLWFGPRSLQVGGGRGFPGIQKFSRVFWDSGIHTTKIQWGICWNKTGKAVDISWNKFFLIYNLPWTKRRIVRKCPDKMVVSTLFHSWEVVK